MDYEKINKLCYEMLTYKKISNIEITNDLINNVMNSKYYYILCYILKYGDILTQDKINKISINLIININEYEYNPIMDILSMEYLNDFILVEALQVIDQNKKYYLDMFKRNDFDYKYHILKNKNITNFYKINIFDSLDEINEMILKLSDEIEQIIIKNNIFLESQFLKNSDIKEKLDIYNLLVNNKNSFYLKKVNKK